MLERLLEFLAPDECIVCTKEGACICAGCSELQLEPKVLACPICNKLDEKGRTCTTCRSKTKLAGAKVAYRYRGTAKDLLGQMKYEGRRSIARYFGGNLNCISEFDNYTITYVPSDGATRRRRGFDQAELIAKSYAKKNKLKLNRLLIRKSHKPQVGMGRQARLANVKDNFISIRTLEGQNILLVDDVITTGATASECARVLKEAGARKVWLLAVAKR